MAHNNNDTGSTGKTGLLLATFALVAALIVAFFMRSDTAEDQASTEVTTPPAVQTAQEDTAEPAPDDAVTTLPEPIGAEPPADIESDPQSKPSEENEIAELEAPAADETAMPEQAPALVPPTIEEVRLEADGVLVVAGRAAPGDDVALLVDGLEVGDGPADASGAFAAIALLEPVDRAQVLTLLARSDAGEIASLDEVILAPRSAATQDEEAPLVAQVPSSAPVSAGEAAGQTTSEGPRQSGEEAEAAPSGTEVAQLVPSSEEVSGPPSAAARSIAPIAPVATATGENAQTDVATASADMSGPAPEEARESTEADPGTGTSLIAENQQTAGDAAEEEIVTRQDQTLQTAQLATEPTDDPQQEDPQREVALLKSDDEGVSLLQPQLTTPNRVALDTIGYTDSGVVQLSGRASAEAAEIRVYLDNEPVARLALDPRGAWRGEVPDVDTGVYTLRVDAVNAAGEVTSRVETPFKREAPAVLVAATRRAGGIVSAVTVQTGDTLWAIARERYGEGVLYVRVFEANRSAIRDPDLIYPGQVFDLPSD